MPIKISPNALGLVLVTVAAALAALIECLLVPLYVGQTVFPITIAITVVGNLILPRMAREFFDNIPASVLPLLVWMVIVLAASWSGPGGDVILPGGSIGWVSYSVMLGGLVAGTVAVMRAELVASRRDRDAAPQ